MVWIVVTVVLLAGAWLYDRRSASRHTRRRLAEKGTSGVWDNNDRSAHLDHTMGTQYRRHANDTYNGPTG